MIRALRSFAEEEFISIDDLTIYDLRLSRIRVQRYKKISKRANKKFRFVLSKHYESTKLFCKILKILYLREKVKNLCYRAYSKIFHMSKKSSNFATQNTTTDYHEKDIPFRSVRNDRADSLYETV